VAKQWRLFGEAAKRALPEDPRAAQLILALAVTRRRDEDVSVWRSVAPPPGTPDPEGARRRARAARFLALVAGADSAGGEAARA
jgi:hypothetical protein